MSYYIAGKCNNVFWLYVFLVTTTMTENVITRNRWCVEPGEKVGMVEILARSG